MSTQLQTIDMTLPIGSLGSLDGYLQRIYGLPMLSTEEECALAIRLRESNDIEAARKLVLTHLRFVAKVAKNYMGYGLALADLIQEGNVGLMKAVKRFDPSMGVRLVSFAVHWIKAEIHEFILKNWRIVKIATTKAQRKLFFNLRKSKKRLGWFTKQEIDDVARTLNVKPETVREMEQRLNAHDAAFDAEDENDFSAPVHYLTNQSQNPAQLVEITDAEQDNQKQLMIAIQKLDNRSQTIIQARWLTESKVTLQDLATQFNVSIERVRQLELAAIKKLKSLMRVAA
ncbi:MAG: RNA polymerase sigma factor RpoH [Pseudomonadota bacterium]